MLPSPRPRSAFVPVRYYDALLDLLEERGHTRSRVFETLPFDIERLAGDGRLTLDEVEAVIVRAMELEPSERLGIDFGQRLQLPSHGSVGIAALTAPTLDAAIEIAVRYLPLVLPLFTLEYERGEDTVWGRLSPRYALDARVEEFHLHAILASFYVQGVFLAGGKLPDDVAIEVPWEPSASQHALAKTLGVRISGGDVLSLRAPASLVAQALPLADAKAHAQARAECDTQLAAMPTPDRMASEVKRALEVAGPPFPSLEQVARTLGASSRTIRRRLDEEGTSYRELLDQTRLGLARRWLAQGDRSITVIGLDLGYSDSANFSRAFRKAYGVSPSDYQRTAVHK